VPQEGTKSATARHKKTFRLYKNKMTKRMNIAKNKNNKAISLEPVELRYYYNTERRLLKFKMARGQISELEVFRSLISCAFVKKIEPIIFGRLEEMKIQF
jgi:hypothetical protein